MRTGGYLLPAVVATVLIVTPFLCMGQVMPATAGETLSGKRVVPAELVRGHRAILVAGFSHDAGMQSAAWRKAVRADSTLNEIPIFELAMLQKAPALIRGVIKNGMRKGLPPAERDQIVVMTQDQDLWEKFFAVENEKDPCVVMLDAKGVILWHGHGSAEKLEPELKSALK